MVTRTITRLPWQEASLLAVLLVVAACDGHRDHLHRPPGPWRHCDVDGSGEQRPASSCPEARLVATASNVPVGDAPLEPALTAPVGMTGPLVVSVEAFAYPPPAPGSLDAAVLANAGRMALGSPGRADMLTRLAEVLPILTPALGGPAATWHDTLPAHHAIPLRPQPPGRHAAYGVWAWPGARAQATEALGPTAVPRDARIRVSFAVAPPGWTPGTAPVTFRLLAGDDPVWERTLDPAAREADRGWHDAEVPLARQAGTTVPLTLVASVPTGASFPVWGQPAIVARAASRAPRPNVLLLSLDTVRADHLSLHGYALPTSPALATFAAGGVTFTNAFSTFPSTTASHMSMLTGLHPCGHGVTAPGGDALALPTSVTTLAEAFAAGGWTTLAITEDALIHGAQGFNRGFDRYVDQMPRASAPLGLFADGIAHARAWLPPHDAPPFFLFLHTYQPHVPYKVPPHVRARYPVPVGASDVERQRIDYDAGLVYTDELLAELLGALGARDLLDDTLIVITSDHGTAFGEHGGVGHALGVHDEQVHVPLVVRHPTLAGGGRRLDLPVSLVDLAPTLLEAAGLPRPASMAGTSLLPLLRGAAAPSAEPSPVFAEQLWGRRQTLFRTATHAWIADPDRTALFDLAADPGERHDLAAAEPARARDGADRIEAFRRHCADRLDALRAAGVAPAPAVDPERERSLRALGYLQ